VPSNDPLARVKRAAKAQTRARLEYAAALVAAVEALEAAGARDPYAQVAAAAGITQQSVRIIVERHR